MTGCCALDHRSKQYRKNAADSLMLSREAMTQASHEYWLTMAEFWLKLAQYVEESKAIGDAAHRSAQAAGPKSKGMGKSK
jgi:cytochrome c556